MLVIINLKKGRTATQYFSDECDDLERCAGMPPSVFIIFLLLFSLPFFLLSLFLLLKDESGAHLSRHVVGQTVTEAISSSRFLLVTPFRGGHSLCPDAWWN